MAEPQPRVPSSAGDALTQPYADPRAQTAVSTSRHELHADARVRGYGCPRAQAEDAVQFAFVNLVERDDLEGDIEAWL